MIFWKAWIEIRGRFWLSASVLAVLLVPPLFIRLMDQETLAQAAAERVNDRPLSEEQADAVEQLASEAGGVTWEMELERWYESSATILWFFAVVLAVGGPMSDAQRNSTVLTLGLPRKRRSWLLAQFVVAWALATCLAIMAGLMFVVVGLVAGRDIPWLVVVLGTILTAATSFTWIGPALLSTSLTKDAVKASLLVFVFIFVSGILAEVMSSSGPWRIWDLGKLSEWRGAVPWAAVIWSLVLGVSAFGAAVWRFERTDY